MSYKFCSRCSTRWTLAVDTCPFCGGPALDAEVPPAVSEAPRPAAAPVAARRRFQARPAPQVRRSWWKFWD